MKVPTPLALPGDRVVVKNYRRKNMEERGSLERIEYTMRGRILGCWSYTILLDRRSATDGPLRLFVGHESIVENLS